MSNILISADTLVQPEALSLISIFGALCYILGIKMYQAHVAENVISTFPICVPG